METIDKAGKSYWDTCWSVDKILDPVDPHGDYVNRQFHHHFTKAFAGIQTQGATLLEIGCARSQWLPYFVQQFGFKVYGLDYSAIGCRQEQQILEKAGVEGAVICADMFTPPSAMLGKFDIVISFGVAEHFENTAVCIHAFAKFLKPGGMLITSIPNMTGLIGFIQKLVNRPIYDIHVPLSTDDLEKSHQQANLQVVRCEYLIPVNFMVNNLNGLNLKDFTTRLKALLLRGLSLLSKVIWLVDEHTVRFPLNRLSGSYVICIAQMQ